MSARMVSKMTAISWENEETISIYPDFVEGVKQPMISLNGKWYYTNTPPEEPWRQDTVFADFELVDVPGEITKQNFEIESDKESYYKKVFCVPEDYVKKYANGKKVYLWEIGKVIRLQDLTRGSLFVDKNPQQFAYCPLSYGESY